MPAPIDVAFLNRQLSVVRVYKHVAPGRIIWWVPGAHSAHAVAVGTVESSETRVGETTTKRSMNSTRSKNI
jgi:hypothetical protein